MAVFTGKLMKRIYIASVILMLAFFCIGCSSNTSAPTKIDVEGMPLDDACEELYDAGWVPHPIDETPYSDYVPGAWENGVKDYDDCKVTRVDFSSSKSDTKSSSSRPACKVYFASGSQPQLEKIYELDVRTWLSWYEMLSEQLAETGPTKETIADINQAYTYVRDYDSDKVPSSYKETHEQIVARFKALLDDAS